MSADRSELFNHAYHLFSIQEYREAEIELGQVIEQEPRNAWACALLALCLAIREDFPAATRAARKAVDLAPALAFTHYALASVLDDQDLFNEALISIRQAISLEPGDVLYHAQMAVIYLQQQRWTEAIEAAARGLEVNANDPDCRHILEQARSMVGVTEHSEAETPSDLPKNPMAALAYVDAGLASLYDGRRNTAMHYFRHALALDPEMSRARWGIVRTMRADSKLQGGSLALLLRLANLPRWLRAVLICVTAAAFPYAWEAVQIRPSWTGPLLTGTALVYVVWIAQPLFNALLSLSKVGSQALSSSQRRQAAIVWVNLMVAAVWLLVTLVGRPAIGMPVFFFLLLLGVPLARIYYVPPGWSRLAMALYAVILGVLAVGATALIFFKVPSLSDIVTLVFVIGVLISAGMSRILIRHPVPTRRL